MPASLGKRKRTSATTLISSKLLKVSKTTPIIPEPIPEPLSEEEASDSSPDDDDDEDDTEPLEPQEIFRRHFEAQFKPLSPTIQKSKASKTIDDAENEEVDDWEGLSGNSSEDDEEEENGVQIVEHVKKVDSRIAGMSKAELRAFMGKNRLKALDLRVQALGGKTSIHKQESMPMAMRKGIVKKAEEKEERRRREAKENGVVLETKGGRGGGSGGRERRKERSGVGGTFDGGPGVGRMRGATLSLSKSDVVGIEGSKRGGGRMGRNGKRGGRGRGRGNRM
ncbi:hypothetical protein SS1G_12458 [Sclerotinia sclerotiorum 1980 UF-70]|uniref:Protein FAF1 n=1 Tax=Sclerotinia sclerotiorum (strain ATCC 18683 / 1980 / Ss-1) TaxID=665079 RepID=A7F4D4_SCLS1|nr:hypothetical protein SS1G_12458 [Sclerotinia sclerotiorum 1980 UF-70]EDN97605.1 hypothetical protein SS1G_12458 [Sclerotinia sclerotiorum 1980 UF-70]